MMKKIIYFSFILIISISVSAQPYTDYLIKAKALCETGKPDESINLLSKLIESNKDSRLFISRAEARTLKGDYSGAISDYNEANSLAQGSGEYGLARIYSLKGDASTSVYHLGLNLKSSFKNSEKDILLDPAFGPVENTVAWRQFWKQEWYSETEKAVSEIEYYTSSGKTSDAITILESLKKDYNGSDDVIYAQSLINMALGKYSDVIGQLTVLLTTDQWNEKLLRILARAQIASLNFAGASLSYSRLIESGAPDAELFIQRAECYRKTGETREALGDIEKYLSFYPGNSKALSLAGRTEAESGDNLMALRYFSDNLKLHPNDPNCYVDRANSYFISKSWDWAIKDYSMSLDLNPGNSDAWLNMGVALLNSGKGEDACHYFRKALSLGSKRASELISKNCIK